MGDFVNLSDELLAAYFDGSCSTIEAFTIESIVPRNACVQELSQVIEDLRDVAEYLGVPELKYESPDHIDQNIK